MYEFLLENSLLTGIIVFTFTTVLFGLSIYLIANSIVRNTLKKGHERVGRVLFRVSASLLALILSITFANQRINYFKLIDSLQTEATKIVQLHLDLEIFGTEEASQIRSTIREYVEEVSKDGWDYLFDDPFESNEFVLFREIYEGIFNLETKTPMQERLKESLINDSRRVADLIQVRLYSTRPESNNLIYTTIFGIFICMTLFSVYPPDKISILFAAGYISFLGIVLYFILMMTTPLEGPLQIKAEPFKLLQERIEKEYN